MPGFTCNRSRRLRRIVITLSYRTFVQFSLAIVFAAVAPLHTVSKQPQANQWTQSFLTDVLDAYLAGRYDEAVKGGAAIEDLGPPRGSEPAATSPRGGAR